MTQNVNKRFFFGNISKKCSVWIHLSFIFCLLHIWHKTRDAFEEVHRLESVFETMYNFFVYHLEVIRYSDSDSDSGSNNGPNIGDGTQLVSCVQLVTQIYRNITSFLTTPQHFS